MLNIKSFVFNPFNENTFVLWDEESKESIIIDPGCYTGEEENEISDFIDGNELKIKYLINTHCHIDHIMGNAFIKEKYSPEFLVPEKDVFLLDNAIEQAGMFGVSIKSSPKPDRFLEEAMDLCIGNIKADLLSTPGHTPGEFCINFPNEKICISGDVLFNESIGRTDLWGGNFAQLLLSIKQKLFSLPEETTVYPGHGGSTTIAHEKKYNPFLNT